MADVADKKTAGKGWSNEIKKIEVEYDFSADGGAVGVLDMLEAESDMLIHDAFVKVGTAFTSGTSSATVELGVKGGDTDAVMAATLVTGLTAGLGIAGASASKGLKLASGAILSAEIKVEAVTAGDLKLVVEYSNY